MRVEATRKRFNVDEYYRMLDVGILSEDCRTELIDGEVIELSPMGPLHAAVVARMTDLLVPIFKGKALLRPQLPLRLNDFSEPQPDIVLLKPRHDFYAKKHPGPSDIFVAIEISDTSLRYDRDVKLPIYAAARVSEVWIADLADGVLWVYRDPSKGMFKTALSYRSGDSVSCLAFPDTILAVDDLLG